MRGWNVMRRCEYRAIDSLWRYPARKSYDLYGFHRNLVVNIHIWDCFVCSNLIGGTGFPSPTKTECAVYKITMALSYSVRKQSFNHRWSDL